MSLSFLALLLASPITAEVLRRAPTSVKSSASLRASTPADSTLSIPLPTVAEPFTTTIPGCDTTIAPLVIIGFTTSTAKLIPGTVTRYVPPQGEPSTTTIIDPIANETEVIIIATLPGECGSFQLPSPPSPTGPDPSPTPEACPEKGCSGKLVRGATLAIDVINNVSLQSQALQQSARKIGNSAASGDTAFAQGPITDVANGLSAIAVTLTTSLPRILFLPAFPPGCDTDTVIIAFIEFVRIHQALLNILIGKAGLLEGGPLKRDEEGSGSAMVYERAESAFVGRAIAAALRSVERVVDTLALKLIELCPTRGECAKQETAKLSASLKESITAYDR